MLLEDLVDLEAVVIRKLSQRGRRVVGRGVFVRTSLAKSFMYVFHEPISRRLQVRTFMIHESRLLSHPDASKEPADLIHQLGLPEQSLQNGYCGFRQLGNQLALIFSM